MRRLRSLLKHLGDTRAQPRSNAADHPPDHVCLVCGDHRWCSVRQAKDWYRPESQAIYKLARCLSCGLVVQQPLPTESELRAAYDVPYVVFRPAWKTPGWPLWKVLRTLTVARRIWRLRRYARDRKLLDVGCGAADFLLGAHRAGWQVQAVEYTSRMAEDLRSELGFDVRTGKLVPGLWAEGEFDVITFWDVLEHISDPLAAMTLAADYLRARGVVLVSIPTDNAVEHGRRFGRWWALLDLPRHLYFFNQTTLSRLCDRAGLELVQYKTPLLDTLWCYFASSWRYASQRSGIVGRWGRLAGWTIAIVFTLPYLAARSWRRRGLIAVAVAVRREMPRGHEGEAKPA